MNIALLALLGLHIHTTAHATCTATILPEPTLDPDGVAAAWNATIPEREVLQLGDSDYLHYPETGQLHLLQPGMTRELNGTFSAVGDAQTVRGPFALFLFTEDFPQEWYNGAHPTRDSLGLGPPRHPVPSSTQTIPTRSADLSADMDTVLSTITEDHPRSHLAELAYATELGAAYARDYHNALLAGTVGADEEEMALRAVRILVRFSEVASRWPASSSGGSFWDSRFGGNPASEHACRGNQCQPLFWVERSNQVENNLEPPSMWLPFMYTLVYNANDAWDTVEEEYGCVDLRYQVERDLFQVILTTHLLGNKLTPFNSNYENRFAALTEILSQWAWYLDDPVLYHFAFRLFSDFVYQGFYMDGVWNEVGYAQLTINGIYDNEFRSFRPFSDPAGYVDPWDDRSFTGLGPSDPEMLKLRAQVAQNATAEATLQFPNGQLLSINDAGWTKTPRSDWKYEEGTPYYGASSTSSREVSYSHHLTGLGHTVLGGGEGEAQYQVHLEQSIDSPSHNDVDYLTLVLFDEGSEVLAENTYANDTPFYPFKRSALDHNHAVAVGGATPVALEDLPAHHPFSGPKRTTDPLYYTGQYLIPGVTVNRSTNRTTDDGETTGVPMTQTLFQPDGPVQATSAWHPRFGDGGGAGHRRTVLSVELPGDLETDRYTLDLYETVGHGTFELIWAGPGQHDYRFNVDGLVEWDGVDWPWEGVRDQWNGEVANTGTDLLGTASTEGTLHWTLQLPEFEGYGYIMTPFYKQVALLGHTAGGAPMDAHLALVANARAWESFGTLVVGEPGRERRKEQLNLRRSSDDHGMTRWLTALEVAESAEDGRIMEVTERIATNDGTAPLPVVAEVVLADGHRDLIFLGTDERASGTIDGISFTGRMGWVRFNGDGEVVDALLHDGTRLDWGDGVLELPAAPTGDVLDFRRTDKGDPEKGFILDGTPNTDSPRAEWTAIEFGDGHVKWFSAEALSEDTDGTLLTTPFEPLFQSVRSYDEALETEVDYIRYDAYPAKTPLGGMRWRAPMSLRLGETWHLDPEPIDTGDTPITEDSGTPSLTEDSAAPVEPTSTTARGDKSGCACTTTASAPTGTALLSLLALLWPASRRRRDTRHLPPRAALMHALASLTRRRLRSRPLR